MLSNLWALLFFTKISEKIRLVLISLHTYAGPGEPGPPVKILALPVNFKLLSLLIYFIYFITNDILLKCAQATLMTLMCWTLI